MRCVMKSFVSIFMAGVVYQGICDSVSAEMLGALIDREFMFKYCGSYTNDVVMRGNVASTRRLAWLISSGCADCATRQKFLECQSALESAVRENDVYAIDHAIESLIGMFKSSVTNGERIASAESLLEWKIETTEYSIARLLEYESDTSRTALTIAQVLTLLPDRLFVPPRDNVVCRNILGKRKAFRNLLVVEIALLEYRRAHGMFPDSLSDVPVAMPFLKTFRGMTISYSRQNEEWELLFSGEKMESPKPIFNVYVPMLAGEPEYIWPYNGCLWLSSDYSRKRKALYRGEIVNSGTPWACFMDAAGRVKYPGNVKLH